MIEILILQLPGTIAPERYRQLLEKIGQNKRERIQNFRRVEDAYRSLLGELLVRAVITAHTGLENRCIRFVCNRYGKPSLEAAIPFFFNLSHSGEWISLIWSTRNLSLGVDVERIKPMELGIAERFFTRQEYADLMSLGEMERLERFFQLWTLKESYIKARGKGLAIPLDSFTLHPAESAGEWYSPEAAGYRFSSGKIDERHYLSACADNDRLPQTIRVVNCETVFCFFSGGSLPRSLYAETWPIFFDWPCNGAYDS